MLLLKSEDLELQGIAFEGASHFVLHNTLFTKTGSFSQNARDTALEMCQKYLRADIVCLMVETQEQITLWREKKVKNRDRKKREQSSETGTNYQNRSERSPETSKERNLNKKLLKL